MSCICFHSKFCRITRALKGTGATISSKHGDDFWQWESVVLKPMSYLWFQVVYSSCISNVLSRASSKLLDNCLSASKEAVSGFQRSLLLVHWGSGQVALYSPRLHQLNRPHTSRTNMKKFTILYRGPKIWNALSSNIRTSVNLYTFKRKMMQFLLNWIGKSYATWSLLNFN